jgi:hypothetical protein
LKLLVTSLKGVKTSELSELRATGVLLTSSVSSKGSKGLKARTHVCCLSVDASETGDGHE